MKNNKPDYDGAIKHILERLERDLSPDLFYHGVAHTLDVLEAVDLCAKLEGIDGDDLEILKTGAAYHDSGFLGQYHENEETGIKIAKENLPEFGFDYKKISIISGIILATKIPQKPTNKLEELMCDADLDNLGREDFYVKTELLRLELSKQGIYKSPKEWYAGTLKFLSNHNYFTNAAKSFRQIGKEKHINEIKEILGIK